MFRMLNKIILIIIYLILKKYYLYELWAKPRRSSYQIHTNMKADEPTT